jgi:hypothetical protein
LLRPRSSSSVSFTSWVIITASPTLASTATWRLMSSPRRACCKAGEPVAEHASDGKQALEVTFLRKGSFAAYRRGSSGWGNPETDALAAWSGKGLFNDEARIEPEPSG